jgi:8-oxo-dGTP pyrophosphatase MutT (NUDIX family)
VFPGGNLSAFHDGPLPTSDNPGFHEDGPAYRLAAIRETFEESGILLARKSGQNLDQGLLQLPDDIREAGRKQIHGNQVKFTEWLKSQGVEPDVGMSPI